MAFDAFLKLDGVKGEATADGHKDEINILSFSWGVSNTASHSGAGAGSGKASLSTFNIMKKTDAASASLFQSCCSGKHTPLATVVLRKAGGEKALEYLKYKFSDVLVTSVQWSGSSGGDDVPAESVSFAYSKVEIAYAPQDAKGHGMSPQVASWDVKAGKKA